MTYGIISSLMIWIDKLRRRPWLPYLLLLLGFAPMLTVFPAPLADWGSHLARVLVTDLVLRGDPFWSERYHFQGFIIPNAILDVVVLGFMRLGLSLVTASVCCLALCYCIFVFGFDRLSKLSDMPKIQSMSVAITLFYTGNIVFGLINYMIGLGMAMLAAAYCLNPALRLWQRCLIAAVLAPIIAFCHIVAVGVFGMIYGAVILFRPLQATGSPQQASTFIARVLLLSPAIIGVVVCAAAFFLSPSGATEMAVSWVGQPRILGIMYGKVQEAAEGYSSGSEIADGILCIMAAIVAFGVWRNKNNIEKWRLKVALISAAIPVLAPFRVGSGTLLDARIAIVPLIMVVIALPWTSGLNKTCQNGMVVLSFARVLILASIWLGYRPVYNHLNRVFSSLPYRSTLLSAYTDEPNFYLDRAPPLHEIAALAVQYGIFVPSMWAEASQQPLVIRSKWRPEWLWSHSANARTAENLDSVRKKAKRYCGVDPATHLLLLHVTKIDPISIESPCN